MGVQTEFRMSVVFAFPLGSVLKSVCVCVCVRVSAHVGILFCVRMLVRFLLSIVHSDTTPLVRTPAH